MNTNALIMIGNDGQRIRCTNYWDTPAARAGLLWMTCNAGAVRLLLPPALEHAIPDLTKGVKHVIVSYGNLKGAGLGVEWLAEDGSDAPYALHVKTNQIDRVSHVARGMLHRIQTSIWVGRNGEPTCVAEFPGYLRSVANLPCLQALPARPVFDN